MQGSPCSPGPQYEGQEGFLQDEAWTWAETTQSTHQGSWPTSARENMWGTAQGDQGDSPGGPGLTCGTLAQELIDFVQAAAILEAGAAGTLILVHLAVYALIAWG